MAGHALAAQPEILEEPEKMEQLGSDPTNICQGLLSTQTTSQGLLRSTPQMSVLLVPPWVTDRANAGAASSSSLDSRVCAVGREQHTEPWLECHSTSSSAQERHVVGGSRKHCPGDKV